MSFPSHVCSLGIDAPAANAGELSWIVAAAGFPPGPLGSFMSFTSASTSCAAQHSTIAPANNAPTTRMREY